MFPPHLLARARYAVLDLETGGLAPTDALMSVAVVLLDEARQEIGHHYAVVHDPGRAWRAEALAAHRLDPGRIASQAAAGRYTFDDGTSVPLRAADAVLADLRTLLTDAPHLDWVGHNAAKFDLQFLASRGVHLPRVLDTLTLAGGLLGRKGAGSLQGAPTGSYALGPLYEGLTGQPLAGAHGALEDARATAEVLRRFHAMNPLLAPQPVPGAPVQPPAGLDVSAAAQRLLARHGNNLTAILNELREVMQIRAPGAQQEIVNALALMAPGLFAGLTPARQAREIFRSDFRDPQTRDPVPFTPGALAQRPEAFAGPYGQLYASREPRHTSGYDLERLWRAGQGVVSRGTGDAWQVENFKGAPVPYPNAQTAVERAANAAHIFKTIKHLHGASGPHEMAFLSDEEGPRPIVTSPFRKRYGAGEEIRPEQANIVRLGIATDYFAGRVFANQDAGLTAGTRSTLFLPGVTDPTRIPVNQWFTGRESQKYLGPGAVVDMDDYEHLRVTHRSYDAERGGTLVTIERKVDVAGMTKLHAFGLKGMISGAASLRAHERGEYPLRPDFQAFFGPGRADFVTDADSLKNPYAFVEALVGARVLQNGGRTYLAELGLEEVWDAARGGIDWDKVWETDTTGRVTWNARFPHYRRAIQLLASDAVRDRGNWVSAPGDDPAAWQHFVAPVLQQITRDGAYSAGKPRLNVELAARIKTLDHDLYQRMLADSRHQRQVYGEVINNALLNAGQPVTPASDFIDLDTADGRALLVEARHRAQTAARHGDRYTHQEFVQALAQALQQRGQPLDLRFAFTGRYQGEARVAFLPSVRAMQYFGGPHWKDDMQGWEEDRNPAARREEMQELIAPFATTAVDLMSALAINTLPDDGLMGRFYASQQRLARAREVHRNLTGFRVRGSWTGTVGGDEAIPLDTILVSDHALAEMLGLNREDEAYHDKLAAARRRLDRGDVAALAFRQPNLTDTQLFPGLRVLPLDRLRGLAADAGQGAQTSSPYRVLINPRLAGKLGGDLDGDLLAAILRGRMEWDAERGEYAYHGARPLGAEDILRRGFRLNQATYSMDEWRRLGADAAVVGGLGMAEERKWRRERRAFQEKYGGSLFRYFEGMIAALGEGPLLSGRQIQEGYGHIGRSKELMEQVYNMARKLAVLSGGDDEYARLMMPLYQSFMDFQGDSSAAEKFMRLFKSYQPATGGYAPFDPEGRAEALGRNPNTAALEFAEALLSADEFGNKEMLLRLLLGHRAVGKLGGGQIRALADRLRAGESADLAGLLGNTLWDQAAYLGPLLQLFRAEATARWKDPDTDYPDADPQWRRSLNRKLAWDQPWGELGQALNAGVSVVGGRFPSAWEAGASDWENLRATTGQVLALYQKGLYSPQLASILRNLVDPLIGAYEQDLTHRVEPLLAKVQSLAGRPSFWNEHLAALEPGEGMVWAKIMRGKEDVILSALESDPAKSAEVLHWARARAGRRQGFWGKVDYVDDETRARARRGAAAVEAGEAIELQAGAFAPGSDEADDPALWALGTHRSTHRSGSAVSASYIPLGKFPIGADKSARRHNRRVRALYSILAGRGAMAPSLEGSVGTDLHGEVQRLRAAARRPGEYSEIAAEKQLLLGGRLQPVSGTLDMLNLGRDDAGDAYFDLYDLKTGDSFDPYDDESFKQLALGRQLIEDVVAGQAEIVPNADAAAVPAAEYQRLARRARAMTRLLRMVKPRFRQAGFYTPTGEVASVRDRLIDPSQGPVTQAQMEAAARSVLTASPVVRGRTSMDRLAATLEADIAEAYEDVEGARSVADAAEPIARAEQAKIKVPHMQAEMAAAEAVFQKMQDPDHAMPAAYGGGGRRGSDRPGGPRRPIGRSYDLGGNQMFFKLPDAQLARRFGQALLGLAKTGSVNWTPLLAGDSASALPFTNPDAIQALETMEAVVSGTLHPNQKGRHVIDAFVKAQSFVTANAGQMGAVGKLLQPGGQYAQVVQTGLDHYFRSGGKWAAGLGAQGFTSSVADVGADAPEALKAVALRFNKLRDISEMLYTRMRDLSDSTDGLTKATGRQKAWMEKAADLQGQVGETMGVLGGVLGSRQAPTPGDERFAEYQQAVIAAGQIETEAGGMGSAPPRGPLDSLRDFLGAGAARRAAASRGRGGARNPLERIMNGQAIMQNLHWFYFSRLHRAFIDPALGGVVESAQDDLALDAVLGRMGISGPTGGVGRAGLAFQRAQLHGRRQMAATWAPAVEGLAGDGGLAAAGSIFTPGLGAGLIAAMALTTLIPATAGTSLPLLAGLGLAGGGIAAGYTSRNAFLNANPDFATASAYDANAGGRWSPDSIGWRVANVFRGPQAGRELAAGQNQVAQLNAGWLTTNSLRGSGADQEEYLNRLLYGWEPMSAQTARDQNRDLLRSSREYHQVQAAEGNRAMVWGAETPWAAAGVSYDAWFRQEVRQGRIAPTDRDARPIRLLAERDIAGYEGLMQAERLSAQSALEAIRLGGLVPGMDLRAAAQLMAPFARAGLDLEQMGLPLLALMGGDWAQVAGRLAPIAADPLGANLFRLGQGTPAYGALLQSGVIPTDAQTTAFGRMTGDLAADVNRGYEQWLGLRTAARQGRLGGDPHAAGAVDALARANADLLAGRITPDEHARLTRSAARTVGVRAKARDLFADLLGEDAGGAMLQGLSDRFGADTAGLARGAQARAGLFSALAPTLGAARAESMTANLGATFGADTAGLGWYGNFLGAALSGAANPLSFSLAGAPGFSYAGARAASFMLAQAGGTTGLPGLGVGTTSILSNVAGARYLSATQYGGPGSVGINPNFYGIATASLATRGYANNPWLSTYTPLGVAGGWLPESVQMGNQTMYLDRAAYERALAGGAPGAQMLGGEWAAQWELNDLSYQAQLASAGISAGNVRRAITFQTGVGLGAYQSRDEQGRRTGRALAEGEGFWFLEDQLRDLGRAQARFQLGLTAEGHNDPSSLWARQRALQLRQFNEQWDFNRAGAVRQYEWQQEDFGWRQRQMAQSRNWAAQDFAWQRQVSERDFGWAMEDLDENIRFATGRERRLLERQKKRLGLSHDQDRDRADTLLERQKTLWKQEDDRFALEKRRADETHKLNLARLDMEKRHFLERMELEQANRDKQAQFLLEREAIEDAQRELQRAFWMENEEAQLAAIGAQVGYATKIKAANEQLLLAGQVQQGLSATVKWLFDTEWDFIQTFGRHLEQMGRNILAEFGRIRLDLLRGLTRGEYAEPPGAGDAGGDDGYEHGKPEAGGASGYHGLLRPGDRLIVNETGEPEWADIYPFGRPGLGYSAGISPGNSGGEYGDVYVLLDGEVLAAKIERRQTRRLYQGRRRV